MGVGGWEWRRDATADAAGARPSENRPKIRAWFGALQRRGDATAPGADVRNRPWRVIQVARGGPLAEFALGGPTRPGRQPGGSSA
jgi:hypothetical protein